MDEAEELLTSLLSAVENQSGGLYASGERAEIARMTAAALAAMRNPAAMSQDDAEDLLAEYVEWRDAGNEIKTAESKAAVIAAMRKAGGVPDNKLRQEIEEKIDLVLSRRLEWPDDQDALRQDVVSEIYDVFAAAPQPPALDRDAIIEACAKVAEKEINAKRGDPNNDLRTVRDVVAAAIRAIKAQS